MKHLALLSTTKLSSTILLFRLRQNLASSIFFNLLLSVFFITFFILTPAYAAGSSSSEDRKPAKPAHSKEYYKAVKLIKKGSFDDALVILETIVQKKPDDADIHNYMGFSFRKKGMLEESAFHYGRALNINPKHLGALEYQGELYIALGQIEKAKSNLSKIDDICWTECSELRELRQAIENAVN